MHHLNPTPDQNNGMTSRGATWWDVSVTKCASTAVKDIVERVGGVVQYRLYFGQHPPLWRYCPQSPAALPRRDCLCLVSTC